MMKKVLLLLIILASCLALLYFGISELYTPSQPTETPSETTAIPKETTAIPQETTAAPQETTEAPKETSAAPAETTEAPKETSRREETETAECPHILSEEWFICEGAHYKTCTAANCDYTTAPEACSGGTPTCNVPASCAVCGTPYGEPLPHIWSEAWDYTDIDGHAHNCQNENCTSHTELSPHTPGEAATETDPQCCADCGYILFPALGHTHRPVKNEEKAPSCTADGLKAHFICEGCGKLFSNEEATRKIADRSELIIPMLGHAFSTATCTTPKTCTRDNCGVTEGSPVAHKPDSSWESDAKSHWHTCTVCSAVIEKAAHTPSASIHSDTELHWYTCVCDYRLEEERHTDKDNNCYCDACNYQMSIPTPPETEAPVPEETELPTPSESTFIMEGEVLEEILMPAQITVLRPEAPGVLTKTTSSATLDYSNSDDGYVMVQYTAYTDQKLKVKVQGPATTYTYNLEAQEWTVFPLSDGSGEYKVVVYKNVTGSKYATVLSHSFSVQLESEFAPFLRPNQYVNFENATNTINTAAELVTGITDTIKKVETIYSFVVNNISYDYKKAATVQSGYLPDLDQVLAEGKGICFDYASLMTGMLRSQNIPSKLIVGYADDAYHAWISVWTPDEGWIDGTIFFDGRNWSLMDPTFVSTGGSNAMNGVTYTSKYIY